MSSERFPGNYIQGKTINDVWRDLLWCCILKGSPYVVEKGSYEGQIRKQLEYLTLYIEEPYLRPLAVRLPENFGYSITDDNKITTYFLDYLLSDCKQDGEDYTYGNYIYPQLYRVIELLNMSKGNTNQACISIGNEKSIFLESPPCLRTIDFKVVEGKLEMSLFFRSWDIVDGLPENLGGLQLLKEYVLGHLDFEVEDGPMIVYSSGAHIYEQYFGLVNSLNVNKLDEDGNLIGG